MLDRCAVSCLICQDIPVELAIFSMDAQGLLTHCMLSYDAGIIFLNQGNSGEMNFELKGMKR